jgi:hypothetical protein
MFPLMALALGDINEDALQMLGLSDEALVRQTPSRPRSDDVPRVSCAGVLPALSIAQTD